MRDVGSSLLLLLVAVLLLWLAVTDRLSRVLDAWDVATGKKTASGGNGNGKGPLVPVSMPTLRLPSLPDIRSNAQVSA